MSTSPSYKGFPSHLFDHGAAELQRSHLAREARHNREARTVRWLAGLMAGQTFHGVDALVTTAANHVEMARGNVTDDERQLLRNAATLIASGLNEPLGIQRSFTP